MGLRFFNRRNQTEGSTKPRMSGVSERYNTYFPRLYAYVRTCIGGEVPTQDIVVQAFARAFNRAGNGDEEKFRKVLFRTARRLCRPAFKANRVDGDEDFPSLREREILSLIFDAGLTRGEISSLFGIREATVSSLLMTGLRKLKEQTSPATAAAYLTFA